MTPKWPEKKPLLIINCEAVLLENLEILAYNAAREDCIKAWEDSPKLVELRPLKDILQNMRESNYGNREIQLVEQVYKYFYISEGKK